jgi:hypothetical protein
MSIGSRRIPDDIRALPLYVEAFNRGRDVGLVIALHALTVERNQLNEAADTYAYSTVSPAPAHLRFADGRLEAAQVAIANTFRQATR